MEIFKIYKLKVIKFKEMQVTSVTSSEMQQREKLRMFTIPSYHIIYVHLSSLQLLIAEQQIKTESLL